MGAPWVNSVRRNENEGAALLGLNQNYILGLGTFLTVDYCKLNTLPFF